MVKNNKRKINNTIDNNNNSELINYDYCRTEKKYKISKNKWISPSNLRNFVFDDCIIDFLKFKDKKYNNKIYKKKKNKCKNFNSNLNNHENLFLNKILNDGNEFEKEILNFLKLKFNNDFIEIGYSFDSIYLEKFNETKKAIENKIPIIYQGVLHNNDDLTFGSPDLIVRSDYIEKISENSELLINDEFLKNKHEIHYVIIDIKCSTLDMNSDGKTLRKTQGQDYFKTQILLYTQALNNIQKYQTNYGYVLGYRWKYTSMNNYYSGNGIDNLGLIDFNGKDEYIKDKLIEGKKWIIDLRENIDKWEIYPNPSHEKLYPNMKNNSFEYEKEKKKFQKN